MRGLVASLLLSQTLAERPATAQNAPTTQARAPSSTELLERGQRRVMQLRFGAARRVFRKLRGRVGDGALAQLHLTSLPLLRAVLQGTKEPLDRFFVQSDKLEAALEDVPAGPWRRHLTAEMHVQRAMAHARRKSFMQAAWAARSAYNNYQKALADSARFYDPLKGMGVFRLVLGTLPSSYRRVAGWIGYDGDVPGGLRALRLAADSSRLHGTEAQVVLAFIHVGMEGAPRKALRRVEELHRHHPKSALAAYLRGVMLLSARRATDAARYLRSARDAMEREGRVRIPFVTYYLADCAFRRNRFGDAAAQFQSFLKQHSGDELKPKANLRLGLALEMQGQRSTAHSFYQRARELAEEAESFVVKRRAARLLERSMTKRERRMLRGRNQYDAGAAKKAAATLRPVFDAEAASQEVRTEAAYRLGLARQAMGEREQALRLYRYAVKHRANPEAKWAPWSQYHMGKMYKEQGKAKAARRAFEAALDYGSPFDYHKGLEQRARFHLALL
jgi:tetratricopeptide (TPR) repeat protein